MLEIETAQLRGWAVFLTMTVSCALASTWLLRSRFAHSFAGGFFRFSVSSRNPVFWRHCVWAAAALFMITHAVLSTLRVMALSPQMWDLGNFDQPLWNLVNGYGLELTQVAFDGNETRFTSHFEPILFLWALPYALYPSTLWLLFGQILFVAGTALVLHTVFRQKHSPSHAAFLAIAFLLFPSVNFAVLNDFHTDAPAMFFLALAYWGLSSDRWYAFFFASVAAMACKEYAALVVLMMGVYALWLRKPWWIGVATVSLAALWFYLAMGVIMPYFNQGRPSATLVLNYRDLGAGEGLTGMLISVFENPMAWLLRIFTAKHLENLLFLFAPLLFLPFFALPELLIASPIFLKDLLADFDIGTHHLAMSLPFLFIATGKVLRRPFFTGALPSRYGNVLQSPLGIAPLAGSVTLAVFLFSPTPLGKRFWRGLEAFHISEADFEAKKMMARIPSGVPLAASPQLAPALTHRRFCYLFPRPRDRDKIDYVVLDLDPRFADMYWCPYAEVLDSLESLKRDPRFEVIHQSGHLWLFKRMGSAMNSANPKFLP